MSSVRKYLPRILGVVLVLGVGALMIVAVQNFLEDKPAQQKSRIQKITLLTPPPPPPKIEKPPEPEVKQEVKVPEPKEPEPLPDVPDQPPPGADLGLDAEGSGAGDGFGLVGRKGGQGLLNGSGDPAMYYASRLQQRIEDAFAEHEDVRRKAYSIVAGVWVGRDGTIQRVELETSTGDRRMDALLKKTIEHVKALAVAPPPDMRQPIRLRISSNM